MADASLLFLHALTGLHPGSGTALGVVDLPIQRERHTGWPNIPASSLKGVLKDACRRTSADEATVKVVFGPDTDAASEHAAAVAITDARLLAFPVRSLKGVFAWVTCPAVIDRLRRDLALTTGGPGMLPAVPALAANQSACPADSPLLVDAGKRIMLEEFEFDVRADAGAFGSWMAERAVSDEPTKARLRSHLVILHDDDFGHFVRHATEVIARIGLDYERKTVRQGALFYEEFLPPETLFYALALIGPSRRKDRPMAAAEVGDFVLRNTPPVLQIGANESIGKGFCALRFDV